MLNLIKKNLWFYLPYIVFLIIAGVVLVLFSKPEIHTYLNNLHFAIGDYLFKYGTNLGDGIVIGLFIFILLFISYRYSIIVFLSTIFVTLVVQSFKNIFLPEIDRPKLYFEKAIQSVELYFVPGVKVHIINSFPSGHTATGFTLFLFIALITKNNYLKLLSFFLALFIGYSRVYLSHHFLNDIYFGSIIAVFFTSIFYIWVNRWKNNKLDLSLIHTLRLNKKNDLNKKN